MKKKLVTYFQQTDPSPARTIAAGFALAQEWYNTVTGDKFYHKTDGVWTKYETSAAPAITQVTYTELVALIGSSSLVPDRTYLLTDYMTTWNDPNTGTPFSSGVIEPLYITATDTDKLSKECKSELYPQDIVYYEVTGDIDNGEGTEGFTKGKIYRRIDTIANNDIGTDWRHITYRRYAMKVENPWTIGNSYNTGDIVDDSGNIYICIDTIADSQSLSDGNWFLYPAGNGEYVGIFESGNIHNILTNNITVPIDPDDHQDFYLFDFGAYVPEQIYNNTIESYFLNNTVITSQYFYGNIVKGGFNSNHIKSSQFTYNRFKTFFGYNILGDSNFYYNEFLESFVYNIVAAFTPFRNNLFNGDVQNNVYSGDMTGNEMSYMRRNYVNYFLDNIMSNLFNDNVLRGTWYYNQCINGRVEYCKSALNSGVATNFFTLFINNNIYSSFMYNRMGGSVNNNTFNGTFNGNDISGEEFGNNTFFGETQNNTIGSNFIANNIGSHFESNNIGSGFQTNTTGSYFTFNNIGNGFQGNIVGESFKWNNISSTNTSWTFRNGTNRLTILNAIDGSGLNIPYIPGTYDKTIRLSNGVLKCDYVDEHSDIIFQEDNTGPTFTFKSNREDLYLAVQNRSFPVSGIDAVTPFIIDWGDVLNPLMSVQEISPAIGLGVIYYYTGKTATDIIEVAVIGKYIQSINIGPFNEITEFDMGNNVPQYLQILDLNYNLLTTFNPSIALPSSLVYLILNSNQLTSFDPSIALPSGLRSLSLAGNQLTSFNPVNHSLPSSLYTLHLGNNQLTSFNPSIELPASLEELYFDNNYLTSFNPSIALPSKLTTLSLYYNQLDTTEVNNTLILLNTTYTTVGSKTFYLTMSPPASPDGDGITAKLALLAKGYNVYTD